MEWFRYEALHDLLAQIRLLTVLPESADGTITIRLDHFQLHSAPAYSALSYVWGHEPVTHQIIINGKLFAVRANLYAALKQERFKNMETPLWVDAISIDQSNLQERNAQVQLMRSIYKNALVVIVWLGEQQDDSDFTMDPRGLTTSRGRVYEPLSFEGNLK